MPRIYVSKGEITELLSRWPPLESSLRARLKAALRPPTEREAAVLAAAEEMAQPGVLEVDAPLGGHAEVCEATPEGAWVMCWLFVPEAGAGEQEQEQEQAEETDTPYPLAA